MLEPLRLTYTYVPKSVSVHVCSGNSRQVTVSASVHVSSVPKRQVKAEVGSGGMQRPRQEEGSRKAT